jgi:hypothetical protein
LCNDQVGALCLNFVIIVLNIALVQHTFTVYNPRQTISDTSPISSFLFIKKEKKTLISNLYIYHCVIAENQSINTECSTTNVVTKGLGAAGLKGNVRNNFLKAAYSFLLRFDSRLKTETMSKLHLKNECDLLRIFSDHQIAKLKTRLINSTYTRQVQTMDFTLQPTTRTTQTTSFG